ncbi:aldose 1-epimerase family protein [Companilactobacillus jidongensis]|uniref:aldose 1-epimerase family protein n=1 Tax=Companilactobacillus jidongensis TaxID=2486006 RepID=UPI000F7B3249|nr:aldose 1-epimerase family protein [Companilactobacillus jidongensis]
MKTIENEYLKAEINEMGAELTSLVDKKSEANYIWNGNPDIWAKHAPNLFPAIGRSMNDHYYVDGKEYEMPQHGVGFFHNYEAEQLSNNSIRFTMKSDEETKKYYPFEFEFLIKFELIGRRLRMIDTVKNLNNTSMSFAVGTHPAFNVPIGANNDGRFEDYYLTFDPAVKGLKYHEFTFKTGVPLRTGKVLNLDSYNGDFLPLSHELFKDGLIVMTEDNQLNGVSLKSKDGLHSIKAHFNDFPQLCLWTQDDPKAKFLCIEPFYGVSDKYGDEIELKNKEGNCVLEANQERSFVIDYDIE